MKHGLSGRAVAFLVAAAVCGSAWADRAAVEKLNTAWDKAFNSRDAKALAAMYHEKATVSPGNGKVVAGRAEIEKLFKGFFDSGAHNHKIDVVDVRGSGGVLHEVANWSVNGAEKDGKKPTYKGVLVNVFEKGADGKWQSVSHIWNAAGE